MDTSWFKINPHSALPLYYQIQQNLLELIAGGKFAPGDMLPAEGEMGAYYGVSRLTVRQAVGELVRAGILARERGRGTFVARPQSAPALRSAGFSERVRAAGQVPSSRVLGFAVVPAAPRAAENLQIEAGAPVYQLTRLRLADGEPQIIETTHLPQAFFPGLQEVDFSRSSLYSTLAERYACYVVSADEVFEPVLLSAEQASLLGAEPHSTGLLLEFTASDQDGRRVEYNQSFIRGDKSRLLFQVRRQLMNNEEKRIRWTSSTTSGKV